MPVIEYITGGCLMLGATLLLLAVLILAFAVALCWVSNRPRRHIPRIEAALYVVVLAGVGCSSMGALFALLAVLTT